LKFVLSHIIKVLKAFANSISCIVNLGHTLANKIQLQMASRYLTMFGLGSDLKMSKSFIITPKIAIDLFK